MALPIFLSAVLPIIMSFADTTTSPAASIVLIATWLVFVADLVVHMRLIPGYLRTGTGKFDLAVVIITAPWFLIPGMGDSRFAGVRPTRAAPADHQGRRAAAGWCASASNSAG